MRPQMKTVPGVAGADAIGGFVKQYQVQPDPQNLVAYGLSFQQVIAAIEANNVSRGANYIEQRQAGVVAPSGAVQTVDGRKAVFVRTADGFEKRDVVLGQRDGNMLEIVSGLSAGETVATSNTFSLKAELSKPADED